MPELPDVEIVRKKLARWLTGRKINDASTRDAWVARPSPRSFARVLDGRRVRAVERRGKWLRVLLDDGARLFSHLGMTGDWVRVAKDAPPERFERARIDAGASSVRYVDARRFGRLVASRKDIDEWSALGPDPLADGVDVSALAKTKRAVKEALMDQTLIAGVGNIIATEALWHARVDPRAPARDLEPRALRTIAREIRREIDRELRPGQTRWSVYGKRGEPCPRCGSKIRSVKLGGRTTAFCPKCQA